MKILLLSSCTGKKLYGCKHSLNIDDFSSESENTKYKLTKLKECQVYAKPIHMYKGRQHLYVAEAYNLFKSVFNNGEENKIDFFILSAAYGILNADAGPLINHPLKYDKENIYSYEVTFKHIKNKELKNYCLEKNKYIKDSIDSFKENFIELTGKDKYDLIFVMLGNEYLKALEICDLHLENCDNALIFTKKSRYDKKFESKIINCDRGVSKNREPSTSLKGYLIWKLANALNEDANLKAKLNREANNIMSIIEEQENIDIKKHGKITKLKKRREDYDD